MDLGLHRWTSLATAEACLRESSRLSIKNFLFLRLAALFVLIVSVWAGASSTVTQQEPTPAAAHRAFGLQTPVGSSVFICGSDFTIEDFKEGPRCCCVPTPTIAAA